MQRRGKPKQKLPVNKGFRVTTSYGAWGMPAKDSAGASRYIPTGGKPWQR